MIEFPHGTVLRLRTARDVVMLIERDDSWNGDSPQRWFLPTGDVETWDQIRWRLDKADEWRAVNATARPALDAIATLRRQYDAAMAEIDALPAGVERTAQLQIAMFVERAAQALAAAAGLEDVNWAKRATAQQAPQDDAPTQVIRPVVDAPAQVHPRPRGGALRQTLNQLARPVRFATDRRFRPGQARVGMNQSAASRWGSSSNSGNKNGTVQ
ncbi:hypothetical protein ACIBTV_26640 [Micromonospora sp. NPDC049366]|uniref:hypothetical protein n=1 Tax=Micromonospora sp. NPDC049366 TaxID=3364271 RepID=UPI00379FADF7